MRLGWCKISVVVGFLSVLSNPLWALDFDREISKQNAKGQASTVQIQSRALNGNAAPRISDRESKSGDFQVQLTTIKR